MCQVSFCFLYSCTSGLSRFQDNFCFALATVSLSSAAAGADLQLQSRKHAMGAELCKEKATKSSRADAREGVCQVAASSFQHY
jgi:hypothetical protein